MKYLNRNIRWLLAVLTILFLAGIASAIPSEQWNKTFGGISWDSANSVQQTSDGGYITAGQTNSYGAGSGDAWLIKTDTNGNEQWNRTFGGVGGETGGYVYQTSDGGYILAANTTSYGAGYWDGWLIKTDANGNEQWNRTFGGTSVDFANSVQQTSDGGYILGGLTYSYGSGDPWLIKTDATGNEQWNRTFSATYESGAFVQQTSEGGYIVAAQTADGAGQSDAWLIKTDATGNEQWNKTFGGIGADTIYFVQQTSDGGYILAGFKGSVYYWDRDVWLIRTDTTGNEQWNRTFGKKSDSYPDIAYSVQQTSDGGYILAGFTVSYGAGDKDAWLIKTDATGNEQWNKTFGGTNWDEVFSVQQTSNGGYILAGIKNFWGGPDAWLIKVSGDVSIAQNNIGYSATVATGQNTYVQSSNGTFGLLLKGQSKTINNSVILNNTGDISAKVEARFNDSIGGVFGLVSGANVLNATNFALGLPSALVPLSSLGADVQVAVAPPGVTAMDARLAVPSDQPAGDYSGTVILTFSNLV